MGRGERLLVSGGAGFVLCNCVHRWLSAHPTHSAVILDLRRVWDAPVQAFLAEFTAAGRLHFFEGDVTRAEDWRRLSETHGTAFTHVVSGAALTPTRADEERRPKDVMAVNTFGTIAALVEHYSTADDPAPLSIALSTTAQFYGQDTLTGANLTRLRPT